MAVAPAARVLALVMCDAARWREASRPSGRAVDAVYRLARTSAPIGAPETPDFSHIDNNHYHQDGINQDYPQFGFSSHKGYPTKAHKAAIQKFGCCPIHRRSFKGVKEYL